MAGRAGPPFSGLSASAGSQDGVSVALAARVENHSADREEESAPRGSLDVLATQLARVFFFIQSNLVFSSSDTDRIGDTVDHIHSCLLITEV